MKRATILFALGALAGCGGNGTDSNTNPFNSDSRLSSERESALKAATSKITKGESAKVAAATNEFGWKLLKNLIGEKIEGNAFISAPSVALALGMTYNGASGETAKAMATTLGLGKLNLVQTNQGYKDLTTVLQGADTKVQMTTANSLWIREGQTLKPEFLSRVTEAFQAKAEFVKFGEPAAADAINAWVKQATNDKITDLVKETKPEEILHLVNAVYFKGDWKDPFDPSKSHNITFNGIGDAKETKFMRAEGNFAFLETPELQMVSLPYGRGRMAMDLVLPVPGKKLESFMEKATPKSVADLAAKMVLMPLTNLALPVFKAEATYDLKQALSNLGMGVAFTDQASFEGMQAKGGLQISHVTHKTYVSVDEQGTEAAAATDVGIKTTSAPVGKEFIANRPFYFQIRDTETGTILFMGVFAKA